MNCSRFQCLFSTPAWFPLIRSTAMMRSSGVRNQAFVGESGNKNLCRGVRERDAQAVPCAPEKYRDDKGDRAEDDHEPVVERRQAVYKNDRRTNLPLPRHEILSLDMQGSVRNKAEHDDGGAVHEDWCSMSDVMEMVADRARTYTSNRLAATALDGCRTLT